ncbi:retinol dehydrogenase 13-like [Anthonomus grandis grandis]|uniref:retinol dehydrogenase 13-like n=1 Tax=Anthonomus grandis grandis TaxID=2921223 RepID=UPI00216542FC|nr:retinol dehydrogenase 13-like [Anthonomus grandis grandis]
MGFFNTVCTSTVKLTGKTAIITGCNTGIGKVTAQDFYKRGARVIMACRNQEKATKAAQDIKQKCEHEGTCNLGELIVDELDLSSLKSIRQFTKKIIDRESRIDILVNNGGVMTCPESKTEDGFEMQFGTNHLGHFLLTILLLPKIVHRNFESSDPSRIVTVSSVAHERGTMNFEDLNWEKRKYSAIGAYGQSKLANILFTKELARRLKEANINNVTTYSLHPGVIATELGRHMKDTYGVIATFVWGMLKWLLKTPEQGAQTTIYCSVDEKCKHESGLYYAECNVKTPTKLAQNQEDAERLWTESLKLVGLPENFDPFRGDTSS